MSNILIIGGGFAGVWAAMSAAATRQSNVADSLDIQLVSTSRHLCIRPRLYEGATEEMMVPLAPLMQEIGVELINESVDELFPDHVVLSENGILRFDRSILAAGSVVQPPRLEQGLEHGFFVDDFASTQKLDTHLDTCLGLSDAKETIVVVGASFSGIEVVTKLRQRVGKDVRLVLIDRNAQPGAGMGKTLEDPISDALKLANVDIICDVSPVSLTPEAVTLTDGTEIQTRTVIFATGFRANALTDQLQAERDTQGRLMVTQDLRITKDAAIFAAGDVASAFADEPHRTLMSCQHAMPMGVVAGRNAVLDLLGEAPEPYSQPFYATCLDLGGAGAVFTNGWDRQIVKLGDEGGEMKAQINTQWIYPPDPTLGSDKIFEMIKSMIPA